MRVSSQENNKLNTTKNGLESALFSEESELSFKPLTEGLGFHQRKEEKEEALFPFKKRYTSFRKPPQPNVALQRAVTQLPLATREELAIFATPTVKHTAIPSTQHEMSLKEERPKPPLYTMFGAWLIDLIVLLTLVCLTFLPLIFTQGWGPSSPLPSDLEMVLLLSALFFIYYFIYFTFMEMTDECSIGKSLFAIRVVSSEGDGLDLKKSFMRTLLGLFSVLLLGIPFMTGKISKWSQTEVIQKSEE